MRRLFLLTASDAPGTDGDEEEEEENTISLEANEKQLQNSFPSLLSFVHRRRFCCFLDLHLLLTGKMAILVVFPNRYGTSLSCFLEVVGRRKSISVGLSDPSGEDLRVLPDDLESF
ncbi:unnamed protein product [Caenorhabditis auriculariae]|uniref:Uncharacterized protein n=1 Tax=Caenorhabditis auriculariae TaxID=2777116 RepID=A0A8S1GXI4_9PELO|nr:unnamed protein product [Caenorhabditis auriculariae]